MNNKQTEWFGNIPTSWSKCRIGSLYKLRNTKVSDKKYVPLSVTKEGVLPQLSSVAKSNAHDDRKLIKVGDFAINSRSDRRGSCGISKYEGSVSLINTILEPREMMSPQYYDWLFHTIQFSDEFYKWGHGIVDDLWTTGWQDMKKIEIPCPPLKIQEKIANFLDSKCSEIDSLVVDIQKEISILEEYKKTVITEAVTKGITHCVEMKNSPCPWIGTVPSHWVISKLKYKLRRNDVKNRGNCTVLSLYREYGVIPKDSRDDNHNVTSEDTSKYKFVRVGDFVINKMKAWQGSVAVSSYEGIVSPAYYVYNFTDNSYNKKYFHYLIRSCYKDEFRRLSGGIREGQWDLPSTALDNVTVLCPPIEEQNKIAEYLDKKTSVIEKTISEKQSQLEILAEYKKSIIYEYVTGKKEVI